MIDINQRDKFGRTLLIIAVWNEHFDLARYLVKMGANINARVPLNSLLVLSGDTALSVCEIQRRVRTDNIYDDMIKFLKRHGAKE